MTRRTPLTLGFGLPGRPPTDGEWDDLLAFVPPGIGAVFAAPPALPHMPPITLRRVIDLATSPTIEACTAELVAAGHTHVAYACGTGSYVRGLAGDADIRRRMKSAGAEVAVTTSSGMLAAMRHLGLHNVAILSPHIAPLNERLAAFLGEAGIGVAAVTGMERDGGIEGIPPDEVVGLASSADVPLADGLYIACTSLRLAGVLGLIRRAIGKPVISANEVTVWGLLRASGLDADLAALPAERGAA